MFKKRKFFIVLLSIILFSILCVIGFAGNYLVDYALAVDEHGNLGSMSEEYTGKQDTVAQSEYDVWYPTISTEEWIITNKDGLKLWAEVYPTKMESDVIILAIHGYTVDHRDIAPAIKPFVEEGYTVITPDQRGRGNSEGNYLGMGYLEKDDVIDWINEINLKYPNSKIFLYGESMGAATIMQAAGQQLPSNVLAIIEDCGYTSTYEMFENQLKERFGLPAFPFLPAAEIIGQFRAGYNFSNASPIKALKSATLPILFIHGGSDDYVPTWMGQELYDSYTGEKELLIIPGADHGESADVNPELYYKTVFNFIDNYR
ncbi:alpha/beta hydrolase [Anaerorhabdus sp.]|uniref:alpha/beta hydrolase n=1 Tax=Anaerorhabdus sp. TaxID=1872524 RepID=UPI002B1F104A|nr:alpha/beta hydrolase [Anaerorhabdus sp.]MEA4874257.1 alpha/beta hydrolase [Anaerorhabdus sp.]